MQRFDYAHDDTSNLVLLEHVNLTIPDQHLATAFYVSGLGLTRDPYLMTGVTNMWINIGRSQIHLPQGSPQRLRGHVALVGASVDRCSRGCAKCGRCSTGPRSDGASRRAA